MEQHAKLPVVVVGAGPIGLSAAANIIGRGMTPIVLEAGNSIATNIRDWAHVRLFSPWEFLVDPVSEKMLDAAGWERPDDEGHPTGGELIESFLQPLSELPQIAEVVNFNHRVRHITRQGVDKVKNEGRDGQPFVVVADTPEGEARFVAQAVVDATGTWNQPNPVGAGGVPATGEVKGVADGLIRYGIPDLFGAEKTKYANKRVAVIGSGHSAQNVIRDLATLTQEAIATQTTWLVRRTEVGQMFGGGPSDQLEARGALGSEAEQLATGGTIKFETGFRLEQVVNEGGDVYLISTDGVKTGPFDYVVANTGGRPDFDIARELRLDIDKGIESTTTMAPLIDPNIHSCGSVRPHGVDELKHPDTGYYPIGMKSYGRAPTFLLMTGYEQARSVVAEIAGDHEAARQIELVLPDTGVCSTDIGAQKPSTEPSVEGIKAAETETSGGCCGPIPNPEPADTETSGGCCG